MCNTRNKRALPYCTCTVLANCILYKHVCAVAPSAPDNLNVDKITREQGKPVVQLSWTKPRNDGGAKITDFVIEQKTPEGEWMPIKTVPENQTCAKVRTRNVQYSNS